MKKEELQSYKDRCLAKHLEINSAMAKLEAEYISTNFQHKVGDIYKYKEVVKKKEIEREAIIGKIEVDYALGVRLVITLLDKETKTPCKFLYL